MLVLLVYVYLKCCLFKMFIKVFSIKRDYLVIKRIIFCNFLNLVYLLISMLSYYLNWILRFQLCIKKIIEKIYCFQIVSLRIISQSLNTISLKIFLKKLFMIFPFLKKEHLMNFFMKMKKLYNILFIFLNKCFRKTCSFQNTSQGSLFNHATN